MTKRFPDSIIIPVHFQQCAHTVHAFRANCANNKQCFVIITVTVDTRKPQNINTGFPSAFKNQITSTSN